MPRGVEPFHRRRRDPRDAVVRNTTRPQDRRASFSARRASPARRAAGGDPALSARGVAEVPAAASALLRAWRCREVCYGGAGLDHLALVQIDPGERSRRLFDGSHFRHAEICQRQQNCPVCSIPMAFGQRFEQVAAVAPQPQLARGAMPGVRLPHHRESACRRRRPAAQKTSSRGARASDHYVRRTASHGVPSYFSGVK